MPAKLILIWDYDAAIGQVNATYPYNFDEEKIFAEIKNVDEILTLGKEFEVRMTFACLGFAAEPGQFPYHVPEQIRKIFSLGHEIASHSWKHEWFPYLEKEQIKRSLARSKYSLETCLGAPGAVKGFVPPFSRPMSWYKKGALSLGDRAGPLWRPGADLGSLLGLVQEAGYEWCRVSYRPLWRKLLGGRFAEMGINVRWESNGEVQCVPNHYVGFDKPAEELVASAISSSAVVVISGHPSGLSRKGNENVNYLRTFLRRIADYQQAGTLDISTVANHFETIDRTNHTDPTRAAVPTSR
jgi:peptidoglycan/xylan/chitin deacetylase (PgdA/CDA1 family)